MRAPTHEIEVVPSVPPPGGRSTRRFIILDEAQTRPLRR